MTNAMGPQTQPLSIVPDFKEILTEVIKKQMTTLGPDITLTKVKSIPGIVVSDDGTVTEVAGEPKQISKSLEEAFTELAGSIVKKTMEPLISFNEGQNMQPGQATSPAMPTADPIPNPIVPTPTETPTSLGTDSASSASPTPPTMPAMTPEIPKTDSQDSPKMDPSPVMQGPIMPTPQSEIPAEPNS
ncbi:MAG: hypothetical protein KGJ07_08955, partial [Patescibacteria group bacterium]|nr:hypothetical protein [Patescibacteria group bacterium]